MDLIHFSDPRKMLTSGPACQKVTGFSYLTDLEHRFIQRESKWWRNPKLFHLQWLHSSSGFSSSSILQKAGQSVPECQSCPDHQKSNKLAKVNEGKPLLGRNLTVSHTRCLFLNLQAYCNRTKWPWRWSLFALDPRFNRGLDELYDVMDEVWLDAVLGDEKQVNFSITIIILIFPPVFGWNYSIL